MGQNIFVQSDDRRIDDYKTLKERATPILKQKGKSAELAQKACQESVSYTHQMCIRDRVKTSLAFLIASSGRIRSASSNTTSILFWVFP